MDAPIKIEHEPATLGEQIRQLTDLLDSPCWKEILLPEIRRKEQEHIEAAINPEIPAETRSHHIEAIGTCRHLAGFPQDKINSLRAAWQQKQKPKPTA